VEKASGTYKITDGKMAGQTLEGLFVAHRSGALDQATANRILTTPTLAANLKPNEREFLTHLQGGTYGAWEAAWTAANKPLPTFPEPDKKEK
jgi:hypothetical protein